MNRLKNTYIHISPEMRTEGPRLGEDNRILVQHVLNIGRKKEFPFTKKNGLLTLNNLTNIWNLQILLSQEDQNNKIELLKDNPILEKLAAYLRNKKEWDVQYAKISWAWGWINRVDCIDFCYILKWRNKNKNLIRLNIPKGITFKQVKSTWQIKEWDLVCIQNREDPNNDNGSFHASIYLWEWLFISKLWPKHDIAIASLESLKNLYKANEVGIIILESEHKERFGE